MEAPTPHWAHRHFWCQNVFITHYASGLFYQIKHYQANYFYFINRKEWDFFKIKHFSLAPEVLPFVFCCKMPLEYLMEFGKTGSQLSQELNHFLGLIFHKFIAQSLN